MIGIIQVWTKQNNTGTLPLSSTASILAPLSIRSDAMFVSPIDADRCSAVSP